MSQHQSTTSKSRKRRERRKKLKLNKVDTSINDSINDVLHYTHVIKQIEQHWPRFTSNPIVTKVVSDMNLTLFDPSNEELKIQILDKLMHHLQQSLLPHKQNAIPIFHKDEKCFMNSSFLSGIYGTIDKVHNKYNLYDVKDSNATFSFMDTWNGATAQDIISIKSLHNTTKQIFNKFAVGNNEKVFDLQTFNLLFHPSIGIIHSDNWNNLIEEMIKVQKNDDSIDKDGNKIKLKSDESQYDALKENRVMNEELFLLTMEQFGININKCMLRYEYYNSMLNVLLNYFVFDENLCKMIVEYSDVKRENEYYSMWWNQTRMGGRADYIPNMTELLDALTCRAVPVEGFKFKVDNKMKQLMERYEKKWNVLLPENLKFIFSLNKIEEIICNAHPNNPVPLSASEWKLLDDRNSKGKLKAFDYDYAIKIMEPHQGDHCWYAVWNKNDRINTKVCIAWHPQDINDDEYNEKETTEPKNEEIHFLVTAPNLITFLCDLASAGTCWFAKYTHLSGGNE